MTVRCIVLKNHKDRRHENRMKYSRSPSFIRIRATKLQVYMGDHHITAINEVKKMLAKEGLDPNDFDLLSFDWSEGLFLDTLFSKPKALSIWHKVKEIDIRHLSDTSYNSGDPKGELLEEYDLDNGLDDNQENLDAKYKKDFESYQENLKLEKNSKPVIGEILLSEKIKESLLNRNIDFCGDNERL